MWRWATLADALKPSEKGARLPAVWSLQGRLVQQAAYVGMSTPDVIISGIPMVYHGAMERMQKFTWRAHRHTPE